MLRVRKPRDFGAGAVFVAFGVVGLWFGRDYDLGTAAGMGPGYFPMLLSWLLIGMGLLVAGRSFAIEGPAIERVQWRSIAAVLASVGVFGLLIERWGAAIAIAAVVVVAALGTRESRWKEVVPLAVLVAVFCVAVFIYGLKQPLPLWVS
jgi:hypothetical protein